VKIKNLHNWDIGAKKAIALQKSLAGQVLNADFLML